MRRRFLTLALVALTTLGSTTATLAADNGGNWQTPAIEGYGRIHPRPDAAIQPDKDQHYKIAFDVATPAEQKDQPNPGLDRVARAVNVFASAGVPLDNLDFVAVIHGPATPSLLTDDQYRQRFDTANPNQELLARLKKAGVKVEVCGQALAEHDFEDAWIDDSVTITLSALSDLAVYANRGYSYQKM